MDKKITEILSYIDKHVEKHEKMPTLTEISKGMGVNKTTLLYRVKYLHQYSFYEYKNHKIKMKDKD